MEIKAEHKFDKFLEELSELSRKHKFVIGGCGCCGSPFINTYDEDVDGRYTVALSPDGESADELTWKRED